MSLKGKENKQVNKPVNNRCCYVIWFPSCHLDPRPCEGSVKLVDS